MRREMREKRLLFADNRARLAQPIARRVLSEGGKVMCACIRREWVCDGDSSLVQERNSKVDRGKSTVTATRPFLASSSNVVPSQKRACCCFHAQLENIPRKDQESY